MKTHALTRALALGLPVLLWVVPFVHAGLVQTLSAHDFARLVELAVLPIAALLWLSAPAVLRPRRPATGQILAFALLLIASTLHAVHPLVAAREVALMGGLLVLAFVLAEPLSDPALRDRVLDICAASAGLYGAVALLLFGMAGLGDMPFSPWDLMPGFDNVRFLNHAQTIALPIAGIVLVRPGAPRWARISAGVALFAGGAILAFYLARASVLGLLIGAIVAALTIGRASWRYLAAVSACAVAGMVALGLTWHFWLSSHVSSMTDDITSTHLRGYLSGKAMEMVLASPWLGVGPMHFAQTTNPIAAHPHNVYAQMVAELGVPAMVLLVALLLRGLYHARVALRRLADGGSPGVAAGLVAATIALLVDAAFSGNFVMPISQLWCAVLLGLLLGVHLQQRRAAQATLPPVPPAWTAARAVVAVCMSGATALAVPEARGPVPVRIDSGAPLKHSGGQALNPRFWSHGWF